MTLADNLPYFQEGCKLFTAAGFGGLLTCLILLSANTPQQTYLATDSLLMVCIGVCFIFGALWLMLDMDKNTDIDIREKL